MHFAHIQYAFTPIDKWLSMLTTALPPNIHMHMCISSLKKCTIFVHIFLNCNCIAKFGEGRNLIGSYIIDFHVSISINFKTQMRFFAIPVLRQLA